MGRGGWLAGKLERGCYLNELMWEEEGESSTNKDIRWCNSRGERDLDRHPKRVTRPTEDGERLSDRIWERAREGSVCHPGCRSKRALSPASLWGRPHQSHRLAADSIDHLQSFIHPIKMLSVHITFVFLWWTQLLLHKDPVVMNIQFNISGYCVFDLTAFSWLSLEKRDYYKTT